MRHLDTEQLLDLADRSASFAAIPSRASVHAESCDRCRAELEGWRRLLGLVAEGSLPTPSAAARRRALAAFDSVRPPAGRRSLPAVLLLDSRLTPAAALRDARQSHEFHQAFRLGDRLVELFWEFVGTAWSLVGNVDPAPPIRLSLRVEQGGEVRQASLDALGEFRIAGIRPGVVTLAIVAEDGDERRLPSIELPDA